MRFFISICIAILFSIALDAQESLNYTDSDEVFRQGLTLFDQGQYLAAQRAFEEVLSTTKAFPNNNAELLQSQSAYYSAVSAAELQDPDAESRLKAFARDYPESNKTGKAYFYLGKISYQNKRYKKAIDWFTIVKTNILSNDEMIDYSFQLGYSYFIKKQLNNAKPLMKEVTAVESRYYYPSNYYYGFICFYQKDYDTALESFSKVKASAMYEAVTPYYIAQIYFYKKNYPTVISNVREALNQEGVKYKKEMSLLLGKAYFEQQEYENAIVYLKAYVDHSRTVDETDIYQLGFAYYKNYEYNNAIENLIELDRQTDSLGQNALYVLADCYMHNDEKSKARDAFQKSATLNHDQLITETSLINYAKLSYELDFHKSSIAALAAFIKEKPDSPYAAEAKELLADVFLATRNFTEALNVIKELDLSNPRITEAYQKISYYKSIELYNDGKFGEALALLQQSLEVPVDEKIQALSHYLMGEILFMNKSYDAAERNYKSFLQLADFAKINEQEASPMRANYNLGYCRLKKKDYNSALSYFDKAIKNHRKTKDEMAKNKISEDLLMRKADCHLMLKQYDQAIDSYDDVIAQNKKGMDYALLQKATIQGLQSNNSAKISTLNSLVTAYPNSIYADDALFALGSTYQEEMNTGRALKTFDQLTNQFPNNVFARKGYLKAGLINYNSGNTQSSISNFKAVIEKYPESIEAREALKAMKEVYVSIGDPEAYITYVEQLPQFDITASEQDTILFESAEENYLNSTYNKAVDGFTNYIDKFPNGSFHLEARFYRGNCHMEAKNFDRAIKDFEFLSNRSGNRFTEQALLKTSGLYYYEFKNYEKSVTYMSKLLKISSNKEDRQFALTGLMRSHYKLNQSDQTLQFADMVLKSNLSSEKDIAEAQYYKGKIYFELKVYDKALDSFKQTAAFYNSEKGAESKYHIALIYFLKQQYQNSLDECFEAKNNFASYEYWIVKTFILMADNYFKMDNTFQAKATLESIIVNFKGDQSLIDQAKRKLDYITEYEKKNSKIERRDAIQDSIIIMEDDDLLNE